MKPPHPLLMKKVQPRKTKHKNYVAKGQRKGELFEWFMSLDPLSEYIIYYLSPGLVLSMCMCSKKMYENLVPIINYLYYFRMTKNCNFHWYTPQLITYYSVTNQHISPSVTHVKFYDFFNESITGIFHSSSSVTHIAFGAWFNQSIDFLPLSLTHVRFGTTFNKATPLFPPSLLHLTFGKCFNQPLVNLPEGLIYLQLGQAFNYPVDMLPIGLNTLEFSGSDAEYNHPVDNLPPNLTTLLLHCTKFNHPITHLPPSLTSIHLSNSFCHKVEQLPPSIAHLVFGHIFNHPVELFPSKLTSLRFGYSYNQVTHNLPSSITHLEFGHKHNQPPDCLPPALTHLYFGNNFNQSVDSLPRIITHLKLGDEFNLPTLYLPPNLLELTFGNKFNQPLFLPPHLLYLRFGDCFNQKIERFPDKLLHLSFGKSFTHPLHVLPLGLTHLTLGSHFCDLATLQCLPKSLERVLIGEQQDPRSKYFDKTILCAISTGRAREFMQLDITCTIDTIENDIMASIPDATKVSSFPNHATYLIPQSKKHALSNLLTFVEQVAYTYLLSAIFDPLTLLSGHLNLSCFTRDTRVFVGSCEILEYHQCCIKHNLLSVGSKYRKK